MGVSIFCLDPQDPAPASVAAPQRVGSFVDSEDIKAFVQQFELDVLTVEIEHINCDALDEVSATLGVDIQPRPDTLRCIQDKLLQKNFFKSVGVAVPDFVPVSDENDGVQAGEVLGFPFMLKARRNAYDGRGNAVVRDAASLANAVSALGGYDAGLYAEAWAAFDLEVAVMVARSTVGEISSYPVVQTVHRDSILNVTEAPAAVPAAVLSAARALAEDAVGHLDGAGIYGVEMFVMPDGGVLLNEVAPRPHNSGHYTMDACATSQFEQALRAVLGWPLGATDLLAGAAIMYNILGEADGDEGVALAHAAMARAYATKGASVHWYDKADVRKGRKVGHVNIVASERRSAREALARVAPGAVLELATRAAAPPVAIIMGSDSDLSTMAPAAQVLNDFGVECEVTVVSAHRTPDRMLDFAKSAHARGVKVIIAGAGGAAHLPGMVAALTPLPVIGVPVRPHGAHLDGLDALLSIVQMPRGVPVATVAIGNAPNAGLLALRMLGISSAPTRDAMLQFQASQRDVVERKAGKLEAAGWQEYMKAGEKDK